MTIDLGHSRLPPFEHQIVGVEALVKNPFFLLADEMGAGKTKQTIDAALVLFVNNVIDRAIVIAPASVRDVWFDQELGELQKHLWYGVYAQVRQFHSKVKEWTFYPPKELTPAINPFQWSATRRMEWIITNYEFVRSAPRKAQLLQSCDSRTLLVLEESSAIKGWKSDQTKACAEIRQRCGRVILLNGTPIADNPLDMFSQGNIMHPSILQCGYVTHFKNRYAILEVVLGAGGKKLTDARGHDIQVIKGWRNLEDIQRRFAPYTLRRLKRDCMDLPEALPPVSLTVALTKETWRAYKAMKHDMVVWLSEHQVASAQQASIKVMRMSQITSGLLGGVAEEDFSNEEMPDEFIDSLDLPGHEPTPYVNVTDEAFEFTLPEMPKVFTTEHVGREKLEFVLSLWRDWLTQDKNLKLLIWCRFKPELFRLLDEVKTLIETDPLFADVKLGAIYGGQKAVDRATSLRLLDPRTAPPGPVLMAGTYGTGSLGINLTACHTVINMSYDYSPWKRDQTAARVDRPGQTHAVSYYDIVAVGPNGQKTTDHDIVAMRRAKDDIAKFTSDAWVQRLTKED